MKQSSVVGDESALVSEPVPSESSHPNFTFYKLLCVVVRAKEENEDVEENVIVKEAEIQKAQAGLVQREKRRIL